MKINIYQINLNITQILNINHINPLKFWQLSQSLFLERLGNIKNWTKLWLWCTDPKMDPFNFIWQMTPRKLLVLRANMISPSLIRHHGFVLNRASCLLPVHRWWFFRISSSFKLLINMPRMGSRKSMDTLGKTSTLFNKIIIYLMSWI